MKNFKLIARGLAVDPLLCRILTNPELWDLERGRQQYPGSAHTQADAIILRWAEEQTLEAAFRDLDAIDYPVIQQLMPEIGRAYKATLDAIGVHPLADLGRVMITRLPPGAAIVPHVDEGLYADHYDRFHLCLQATPGAAQFSCGGETVWMFPGDLWWFNHKREHALKNTGLLDRIHLIIDVTAPEYRALRGIYYQAERVSDLWDEVMPLLQAHWHEVAHYPDIPLDPAMEEYDRMEAQGMIRCFTVRDCGRLVGYVAFFVRRNLHYQSSIQAMQDVLFLLPEYRRGMTGVRLIRHAERRLAAEGVNVVYHHAKRTNKVGELLERLGYELIDQIHGKRLN